MYVNAYINIYIGGGVLAFDPQPWSGHWSVLGGTELMDPPTLRSLFSPGTAGMRKKKIVFFLKKKIFFFRKKKIFFFWKKHWQPGTDNRALTTRHWQPGTDNRALTTGH